MSKSEQQIRLCPLASCGPEVSVQWPSLRNFSDQLSRSRVKTCLLLFFGQILLRVLTAAMRELVASLMPFLCQPRKDQRKPRCIPYLRVVDCFRVVDRLRDIFLYIRHHPFGWHLLSINARHATPSLNISLASFRRAISSLVISALLMIISAALAPVGHVTKTRA